MVGGEIIIPNLYLATGYEDTTNEDAVIDEIDDVDFIEPEEIVETEEPRETPQQVDEFEGRFEREFG
jgi:hypothetical protein